MIVNDRIKRMINMLERGSRANFARKVGISPTYVSKMLKPGVSMRESTLSKILEKYPDVSDSWLKTGAGEMLKNAETAETENVSATETENVSAAKTSTLSRTEKLKAIQTEKIKELHDEEEKRREINQKIFAVLLKHSGLANLVQLAIKLNVTPQLLYQANNGKIKINKKLANTIASKFPDLPTDWISSETKKVSVADTKVKSKQAKQAKQAQVLDRKETNQRVFAYLLKHSGLTNLSQFATKIGVKSQLLYQLNSGKGNINKKLSDNITSKFPDLPSDWISGKIETPEISVSAAAPTTVAVPVDQAPASPAPVVPATAPAVAVAKKSSGGARRKSVVKPNVADVPAVPNVAVDEPVVAEKQKVVLKDIDYLDALISAQKELIGNNIKLVESNQKLVEIVIEMTKSRK